MGKRGSPGSLSKKDEVHCQTAPCACSSSAPTVFTAFSHSGSVGRRFPPSARTPPPRGTRRAAPARPRGPSGRCDPSVDELRVLRIRHERAVDTERRQSTTCAGRSLSYAQGSVRAQRERPARNEDVAARRRPAGSRRGRQARRGRASASSSRRAGARAARPCRRGSRRRASSGSRSSTCSRTSET